MPIALGVQASYGGAQYFQLGHAEFQIPGGGDEFCHVLWCLLGPYLDWNAALCPAHNVPVSKAMFSCCKAVRLGDFSAVQSRDDDSRQKEVVADPSTGCCGAITILEVP